MTYVAAHAAGIAFLIVVFHATGALAARVWRPLATAGPRIGLQPIAAGIAIWAYWLFFLASVGLYRPRVLIGSALVAVAAGAIVMWRDRSVQARPSTSSERATGRLLLGLLAWLAPAIVLAQLFVRTLGPWLGWDDMTAQLTLPKLYLDAGGFRRLPLNVYSHWPSNVQLIYGLGLSLGDYVFGKLLHLAFLTLLTLGVYRFAARAGAPWAGLVAAALLLANDAVLVEAPVANIDIAVAFFFFMAVAHAVEYRETGSRVELILSGLFCGCVAGSKITGLGSIACVFPLIVFGSLAHDRERRLASLVRNSVVFVSCAFALALPWLVKSYLYTGDPLYPVLWKVFGGIEWSDTLNEDFWRWQNAIGMGRTPRDYLLLPIRVILNGGGGYENFAAWISKTWILFLPLTIVFTPWVPVARRFLLPAALYFAVWAFSSQQSRFLISVLPLLAVATAVTAAWVVAGIGRLQPFKRFETAIQACAIALVILGSLSVLAWSSRYLRAGSIEATRNLFVDPPNLAEWTPDPVYTFIRQKLPKDAKVLLVNTNHGFFVDRDYVADSFFEASQLRELTTAARNRAGLTQLFNRLGVTHVLEDPAPWVQFPPVFWSYMRGGDTVRLIHGVKGSMRVWKLVAVDVASEQAVVPSR